jgi:hypothetical protein
MAATLLNEMGIWNPDAIERQLAHMENNGVRRAYARGQSGQIPRVQKLQNKYDKEAPPVIYNQLRPPGKP